MSPLVIRTLSCLSAIAFVASIGIGSARAASPKPSKASAPRRDTNLGSRPAPAKSNAPLFNPFKGDKKTPKPHHGFRLVYCTAKDSKGHEVKTVCGRVKF